MAAALALKILLVVMLATFAFAEHQNHGHQVEIPRKRIPGFANVKYVNQADILTSFDIDKIDNKLLKELVNQGGIQAEIDGKRQNDIRDWLLVKSREYTEGEVVNGRVDGMAETPLGNISLQCYNDVTRFFLDFEAAQVYALKMWASWGDVTAWFKALFTGNAKSPGAYELCTGLTKEDDALPFDVQYCMMQAPAVNLIPIYAAVGSCWPASCSAEDLATAHKTYLGPIRGADNIYYDCFEDIPWSGGAIATLCILSFFALIVLTGTVYHVTSHDYVTSVLEELKHGKSNPKAQENVYEQIVHDDNRKGDKGEYESSFSSGATSEKCVGTGESDTRNSTDDQPPGYEEPRTYDDEKNNALSAVDSKSNGTTQLVIEDETYGSRNVDSHKLDNPAHLFAQLDKTAFFAVLNGTFSVDTFFLLSGFLVTYLTLKELRKTSGRINWFLFYFHRFWRITPLYMVTLAIFATLTPYLGKGGGKDDSLKLSSEACQKYWWTNLLYISNLYPFPGNLNEQCMGWGWYLSNDMQFFIISPFIIYCLYKYYNNRTTTTPGIDQTDDFIYGKPYVRIQVYLVGMMLGYIIYKMNGKPYELNKVTIMLGFSD
ncbi:O-acyltransferase like protein-like [Amphiura filiformis]|uniref:O-acyltransferase like protein-like n=1 Tax=Amphiura filiformis TaxID=82378 RepID=UPI003B20FEA4